MEVLELRPFERVVWRVIDGPEEWVGTTIEWSLHREGDYTIVLFKHEGWKQPVEFMYHCSTKWGSFLLSLKSTFETAGRAGAQATFKSAIGTDRAVRSTRARPQTAVVRSPVRSPRARGAWPGRPRRLNAQQPESAPTAPFSPAERAVAGRPQFGSPSQRPDTTSPGCVQGAPPAAGGRHCRDGRRGGGGPAPQGHRHLMDLRRRLLPEQDLDRPPAHLEMRDGHAGQLRPQPAGEVGIVEGHHRNVIRDGQPERRDRPGRCPSRSGR